MVELFSALVLCAKTDYFRAEFQKLFVFVQTNNTSLKVDY